MMQSIRRLSNVAFNNSNHFRYILKPFNQLKKGDIVYHPKLEYLKSPLYELKDINHSQSMDYGGHTYNHNYYTAHEVHPDTLDVVDLTKTTNVPVGDFAWDVRGFNRQYNGLMFGFTNTHPKLDLKLFNYSHIKEFKDTKFEDLKPGDIVKINYIEHMEGHLELTEYVQRNGPINFNRENTKSVMYTEQNERQKRLHKIHEEELNKMYQIPFWLGNVLDIDLNKIEQQENSVSPETMKRLQAEGLIDTQLFKVLNQDKIDNCSESEPRPVLVDTESIHLYERSQTLIAVGM